jgi:hypothetical protein
MPERWKPVVGWEGLYEVSDQGRVRSRPRIIHKRNGRKQTVRARVRKTPVASNGYKMLALYRDGVGCFFCVHALVLEAFCGARPAGYETRHKNGDKLDNRLANLAYGTCSENYDDRRKHGTSVDGERHGMAKLTAQQILAIRAINESVTRTAERYGVTASHVRKILARETWRHI